MAKCDNSFQMKPPGSRLRAVSNCKNLTPISISIEILGFTLPVFFFHLVTELFFKQLINWTCRLSIFSAPTFSALPSLAEHCSVLNSNSCFLAMHSSYLAWSEAMPSSTSANRAFASARTRWVSCNSSVACLRAAYIR